ncbi:MAG: PhoH family protein [Planctomycetota bacterium]|nr:PhoH family protein [Planctomycetota bacterium]
MPQETLSFTECLKFQSQEQIRILFGCHDQHLRQIRDRLGIHVVIRGDELRVSGSPEQVQLGLRVFSDLKMIVEKYADLSASDVESILGRHGHGASTEEKAQHRNDRQTVDETPQNGVQSRLSTSASAKHPGGTRPRNGPEPTSASNSGFDSENIDLFEKTRRVKPRTEGQARYVNAIRENDLVLCLGPAGCGKTYLAVAMALNALRTELVRKIVLVRPAVEAGEKLGFLPGDLLAKVNPYLRPLLDALADIVSFEQVKRYMENDIIEIVPLAYMRGRTLNDTFIILDEAQNTTSTQMQMFLTRMGENSRIVVTGDPTQVDLPNHVTSGLIDAANRLLGIPGVEAVELSGQDIVRHRLVRDIVRAYDDSRHTGGARHDRK